MGLIISLIDIYMFIIIVRVILSWIPHNPSNKAAVIIRDITDPVMKPVQKHLPALGGMDLSPLVVIVALEVIKSLLIRMIAY